MGNRGKVEERQRARELRGDSWTMLAIATELGVSKSSVSQWVRDVDFVPTPRNRGHPAGPKHPMRLKKEAEIERCRVEAEQWVGELSERDLAMFALGLYAGEGAKTNNEASMANTNPAYLRVYLAWLRAQFDIDESRLKAVLYLHEDLDLDAAELHWSAALGVPLEQFRKPYRAVADESIRSRKHMYGCATVRYQSAITQRRVMARIEAIVCRFTDPG